MAKISLNSASLETAAQKIEDAANRIDAAINKIDATLSDLDSVWSDQNSKKYLARYAELKQDFPAFQKAAHDYSAFLLAVVAAYRKDFIEDTSAAVN